MKRVALPLPAFLNTRFITSKLVGGDRFRPAGTGNLCLFWRVVGMIALFIALSGNVRAQTAPSTITVSGACLGQTYTLNKFADDYDGTGRPAYTGTGDVTINGTTYTGVSIAVFYEPAGPAWVLAFDGGAYMSNPSTGLLPPTTGWVTTDGGVGPCTGSDPLVVSLCIITCPTVAAKNNDAGQCGAIVNYSPATTTGDCGSLTYSHASGSFFPVGTTVVTVSSPSTGQQCTFNVVVNDTEFPQIGTCPGNQSLNTSPNLCTASASFSASATDNCPGVAVKYFINYGTGTQTEITSPRIFPKGTTTVTVQAKDASNNISTCTFTITVTDTQNPTVTAPGDVTVSTGPGAVNCSRVVTVAEFGVATHSDNCPGETVQITGVPAGNLFPVGTTVLTYTVTDAAGLQSTDQQNIIVNDNTPPVITCPGNVTVYTGPGRTSCDQVATWTAPTATDNCGTVTQFAGPPTTSGTFPTGTTTVSYTFQDASGNLASCTFTVTVIDNTPPAVTGCPSNITVNTGPGNSNCSQTATWTAPTATDNCDGSITPYFVSHTPGSVFPVGNTTVTYKFKDILNNESICSFTVTVVDNTPPVISGCPGNQNLQVNQAGCTATATWTEPSATDNCTAPLTWYSRSHAPGSTFSGGTTTVTYKFKDATGNESICSFTITVTGTVNASIADAYAYTPGTSANTIYRGWTPASQITYNASASGGQPPYSYLWTVSPGLTIVGASNLSTVKVTGTTAGTYTLTLKVTDAFGCQETVTKTITVEDVRCGQNMDKVLVCQAAGNSGNTNQLCLAANAVANKLAQGSTLGACPTAVRGEYIVSEPVMMEEQLTVKALPNPTMSYFNIEVSSGSNEKVTLKVFDLHGRVIETHLLQGASNFRIGYRYEPGIYMVEVRQGEAIKTIRLMKLGN